MPPAAGKSASAKGKDASPKRRKSAPDGVGVLRTDGPPLPRRFAPRGYWSAAERQRRAAAAVAAAAAASSSASSAAAAVVRVAAAPLVPVSPIMTTTHSTLFYSLANDDLSQGGLFSDSEDDEAVQADRIGIVPLEEVVSRRNENGNRWAVSTAANSPRPVPGISGTQGDETRMSSCDRTSLARGNPRATRKP